MKNALFVVMALFAIGANAGTIKITDGAHMVLCVCAPSMALVVKPV